MRKSETSNLVKFHWDKLPYLVTIQRRIDKNFIKFAERKELWADYQIKIYYNWTNNENFWLLIKNKQSL